jgi:hypothetical protein
MFVGVDHIWVVPSISIYFANNIINLKELDCGWEKVHWWPLLWIMKLTEVSWFQEAEMDPYGVCVQVWISKCARSKAEVQGDVLAAARHPALRYSVTTLLPLCEVLVSLLLLFGGPLF